MYMYICIYAWKLFFLYLLAGCFTLQKEAHHPIKAGVIKGFLSRPKYVTTGIQSCCQMVLPSPQVPVSFSGKVSQDAKDQG